VTPNARSYYELLSFISDLLIRNPNPNLRKLLKLKVKVTTEKYISISAIPWMKIFRLNDGMDPFEAYFKIYLFSKGKKEFKNLLIGIDPGRRMGLAVIGDGEILDLRIFHETREIVEYLRELTRKCPARKYYVRVGNGVMGDEVANALDLVLGGRGNVKIHLVDEERSSSGSFMHVILRWVHDKDLVSAIRIALCSH